MHGFHGHCMLGTGILFLLLLDGLCVGTDEEIQTFHAIVGGTLKLPFDYSNGNYTKIKWKINQSVIIECNKGKFEYGDSRLRDRAEMNREDFSLTLRNLKLEDTGLYSVVVEKGIEQLPTKLFNVYIHRPVEDVQIQSNVTRRDSSNACVVHVGCHAPGHQNLIYSWSGRHNGSGAQLHFTLSPADGDISLTCTVSNNVSVKSKPVTVSCRNKIKLEWYVWAAIGAGILLCLICGIAVIVYRLHAGNSSEVEGTVYADINSEHVGQKDKRSESINNGMSVYETVDCPVSSTSKKPATVYDIVQFSRHKAAGPSPSSPYQDVL